MEDVLSMTEESTLLENHLSKRINQLLEKVSSQSIKLIYIENLIVYQNENPLDYSFESLEPKSHKSIVTGKPRGRPPKSKEMLKKIQQPQLLKENIPLKRSKELVKPGASEKFSKLLDGTGEVSKLLG